MIKADCLNYDLLLLYLDNILSIEVSTIQRSGNLYDKKAWTKTEFLAGREKKDKFSCIVTDNNNPVGFSIAYEIEPYYAHISRLAVLSSEGKKYGSTLLDFQLSVLKENKVNQCSVDLIKGNEKAFQLYNSRGYVKLVGEELIDYLNFRKRDHEEYLGEYASHIAMIKKFI